MASVSPSRSTSTPLTGPGTTETPGAIFSTGIGDAAATRHTTAAQTLLAQPSLIGLQHILPFVDNSPAGRLLVLWIKLEHHLDRTLDLPWRELGNPRDRARCGGLD